jgi:hypothetical protein
MYLSLEIKDFDHIDFNVTEFKKNAFRTKSKNRLEGLERYILKKDNILNATEIQKHLFPTVESDIFLSHAHADEDKVISLAVCLESMGFQVFVDSCVWENAFELLRTIDNNHCQSNGGRYDYQKRNFSTANVYMILNAALHHMIQKAELFIFLGTEQSLTVEDSIENQQFLKSPWVFSELNFVNQVIRYDNRQHLRPREVTKSIAIEDAKTIALDESLKFQFNKPILDFSLSNHYFVDWLNKGENLLPVKKEFSSLDSHIKALENLYSLMKEKAAKREENIFQQYINL